MKATWFAIPDVFLVEPRVFGSERLLFESCYKITEYYTPDAEGGIASNDPSIAIAWPTEGESEFSIKDPRAEVSV